MTALLGREEEFGMLKDCVQKWIDQNEAMCLFVNGVPGTGKTATVLEVVKSLQKVASPSVKAKSRKRKADNSFKYAYVNCHGLNKQNDLCTALHAALNNGVLPKKLNLRSTTALNELETTRLMKSKTLLVLDEIDSLKVMGSALFSRVFQWPGKSDGNLFIIGISNVLNIVESYLPKRFSSVKPKTVTFKAYAPEQINAILLDRLKSKMDGVETKAIELCAKKVAAMTGDIRRAFTIAESMINMRPPDEERNIGLSTPRKGQRPNDENMAPSTPRTPRTPASACRDTIKLINQVEASPIVRSSLPFQPKLILACILSLFSRDLIKGKTQTATKQQIFDICTRAAKKLKLESCPPEGIKEGLDMLCMQGIITIGKDKKVCVIIPAAAARAKIADNDLIAQVNEISV